MTLFPSQRDDLAPLRAAMPTAEADTNISDIALCLAGLDRPDFDAGPYTALLSDMGGRLQSYLEKASNASLPHQARLLGHVISTEHRFAGSQALPTSPLKGDFAALLDERLGTPMSLGLLYLDVARRSGLKLSGTLFPGHFLLRLDAPAGHKGRQTVFIDPYNDGAVLPRRDIAAMLNEISSAGSRLSETKHLGPITALQSLLRWLNSQKLRALAAGDTHRAHQLLARMVVLDPGAPALRLEYGLHAAQTGQIDEALDNLGATLDLASTAEFSALHAYARDALAAMRRQLH